MPDHPDYSSQYSEYSAAKAQFPVEFSHEGTSSPKDHLESQSRLPSFPSLFHIQKKHLTENNSLHYLENSRYFSMCSLRICKKRISFEADTNVTNQLKLLFSHQQRD